MIQFYAPDIETDPILPESDSQHCVRVLRMQKGDELEVVDGKGHRFLCRLAIAHHKRAMVEVLEKRDLPLSWSQNITVAVAPTKHLDRMEWLVEKLVEIGINRIIPIKCRYSERKEIKTERLEKIAISAMKQSLKAVATEIRPMTPIADVIKNATESQRYIAYCTGERQSLSKLYHPNEDAIILIGPEGDFSQQEVDMALEHGFVPVTLGENRLRTETAALYAVTAMHIIDDLHN